MVGAFFAVRPISAGDDDVHRRPSGAHRIAARRHDVEVVLVVFVHIVDRLPLIGGFSQTGVFKYLEGAAGGGIGGDVGITHLPAHIEVVQPALYGGQQRTLLRLYANRADFAAFAGVEVCCCDRAGVLHNEPGVARKAEACSRLQRHRFAAVAAVVRPVVLTDHLFAPHIHRVLSDGVCGGGIGRQQVAVYHVQQHGFDGDGAVLHHIVFEQVHIGIGTGIRQLPCRAVFPLQPHTEGEFLRSGSGTAVGDGVAALYHAGGGVGGFHKCNDLAVHLACRLAAIAAVLHHLRQIVPVKVDGAHTAGVHGVARHAAADEGHAVAQAPHRDLLAVQLRLHEAPCVAADRGRRTIERLELEQIALCFRIVRIVVAEHFTVAALVQHRENAVVVLNGAPAQHLAGKVIYVVRGFLYDFPAPVHRDSVQIAGSRFRRKALVNGGVHQLCRKMVARSVGV